MNWLFSYGTLQLPEVQFANFGRELEGEPDALEGYVLSTVVIGDPAVVEVSGLAEHLILVPGDGPPIEGVAYALTDEELAAADDYETSAYRRVEVALKSGRRAFVYVAAH
ncbi:MAG: gamma-glutamylcyclotransferase family protein [Parcubacteria group bacterium]